MKALLIALVVGVAAPAFADPHVICTVTPSGLEFKNQMAGCDWPRCTDIIGWNTGISHPAWMGQATVTGLVDCWEIHVAQTDTIVSIVHYMVSCDNPLSNGPIATITFEHGNLCSPGVALYQTQFCMPIDCAPVVMETTCAPTDIPLSTGPKWAQVKELYR